ncbi:Filamentous hemagglutinin-like protein [Trichormus variabilis ATCC 29413]|uniref:Filamentous hemagglutinin-like protein n=2 Tax=Anabaena variabilis TaxID=264691 RepID=Q3MAL6_TRIV2|nr:MULTISPECIES: S-layer family protein [Nostocaceae]ABA21970.1 Filamentous hemagglutinin-like protein [Trichormus variabilis ATCC 29413]MBC1215603.1 S-layer family protein [Trichormus variabilis ARAD]MBC1254542.1 S-layer family protein [Trichormus variabilis V5]MBC1267847.1 S-layer family protein [Trichormus variabilis FSR]MBC1304192.1 S-layer family protein [Trichormus variabilis N2B]
MKLTLVGFGFLGIFCLSAVDNNCVYAQVIPDHTLKTSVSGSNPYIITDGTRIGNNLFHSFSQFSILKGDSASFDNAIDIQNIFSRVTGGNISNIDGSISANGNANLFLINPAGIIFGQNASLNIGGSFVGTTAETITFADGKRFSSTDTDTSPLLTMNVPTGLQFGSNSGGITVQGTGHNAQLSDSLQVSGLNLSTRGLQLQPGKTLGLLGSNIALDGGLLSAPGGLIELGGITSGNVILNSTPQGFAFQYSQVPSFGNLQITQRALASTRDFNGESGGAIHIQGKQVSIRDGSLILVQNRSQKTAGDIAVDASESLELIGKSPDFQSSSSLVNESTSSGKAGNIIINTPRLNIDQGGYIYNRTFSTAPGGNIIVNTDETRVNGFAYGDPSAFRAVSQILAASYAGGKGGNISVSTQKLSVLAGGNIAARPYAGGNGGDVTVKADTIEVDNTGSPTGFYFSLISTATFGSGNAGNLALDTRKLSVQAGGRVSASSIILGNAGVLTINASESIDVSGVKDADNPSYIGTAVRPFGAFARTSRANSGNTTINTPVLNVTDRATVFVENSGLGTAGTLQINANTLKLDNHASILASTKAGEGGNINLQLRDVLLMRHGSFINAEAGSNGNGGNISINSPNVVGLENSDIIANAVQGKGGNIQITTQGIIGLEYRNLLNPREILSNDITASSQFSISGTVQINNVGVDPNSGLIDLPTNLSDPSQQVATGCSNTNSSSFVATGRGGIPQNPTQQMRSDRTWSDIRDISAFHTKELAQAQIPQSPEKLVQATSWHRNAQGKIELVAAKSSSQMSPTLTCAAAPQN